VGVSSCVEDNASSKEILLACLDWQCKSLTIFAFELQVASFFKKKSIYVA